MGNKLGDALAAHLNSTSNTASDSAGNSVDKNTDDASSTFGQLSQLIQNVTGIDAEQIEPESRLEDLAIPSLSLIELTIRAEEAFRVQFEEGTVLAFETVGDIANYIDHNADEQGADGQNAG